MLMGKVVGNIVSTRKHEGIVGSKILEIQVIENGKASDKYIIAVDHGIGAGIGERVLVTTVLHCKIPKHRLTRLLWVLWIKNVSYS